MQILLNGEPLATEVETLEELCHAMGYTGARIATAVNGSFIASPSRNRYRLSPDDEVEILAPRQGG